ncbi:MAG: RcnB family protein, partial [Sphingomonas sp.]
WNGGVNNGGWRGFRGGNGGAVAPGPQVDVQRDGNRDWRNRGGTTDNRGWRDNNGGDRWQGNRNDGRNWNDNRRRDDRWRGNDRGGNWNRSWRNDNRYDWQHYRSYNRNAYRLPRYYAPYGWSYGYRSFGVGAIIDSMLFDQSYWIDDPYDYRLPDVYGPYRWVRYYNDALLVDIYTGEVVDVVHDIFW